MEIESIEIINKYLRSWLKKNGFKGCKIKYDTDFAYNEGVIYWSLLFPEKCEIIFNEVLKEIGLRYDCDPFITAFFHELGHFMTEDYHDQKLWNSYDRIVTANDNKTRLTKKGYMKYYHHPIEYVASIWAVKYINDNPNIVKDFWDNLKPLIFNVYNSLTYKVNKENKNESKD